MRQVKPFPLQLKLAATLAQRLQQIRHLRNMTVKDVAKASHFSQQRIEDLECGLETWLSTTDRQLLAKALVVEPALLEEVEVKTFEADDVTRQIRNFELTQAILAGARDRDCPDCGKNLRCSVQEGIDLDGQVVHFAKAYCLRCPYVLK